MPRCLRYHSYSAFGSFALKKIPPRPMTRFMDPPWAKTMLPCTLRLRLTQVTLANQPNVSIIICPTCCTALVSVSACDKSGEPHEMRTMDQPKHSFFAEPRGCLRAHR